MKTVFESAVILRRMAEAAPREFSMQNLVPDDPFYGAYISPEHWLDEAGHVGTTRLIVRWGYLALAQARQLPGAPDFPPLDALIERIELAADYLLRIQRPSGLIDLRNTNYESGPDTAFALQLICAFIEMARATPELAGIVDKLTQFARRAAQGVAESGFHTPNHRWVIVGALALARAVLPDLEDADKVGAVIDAYLAEGIDIDSDGAYLERSIGVYDAVTARSLLFYVEYPGDYAAGGRILDAVTRNLEFDLHLLHPDGTAETGLSVRQDYGQRLVPTPLIANYLNVGLLLGRQDFIDAAAFLYEKSGEAIFDLEWLCYVLLKWDRIVEANAAIPTHYSRAYPSNKLWRHRDGETSASVFGGRTRLFHLVYRSAELVSIKIAQAYFSVGLFIADDMEMEDGEVLLRSSGVQKPNLPAYHLPLGRPVPPEAFEASKSDRDQKRMPPAESILKITPVDGGFDLLYRTLDGLDDVIAQIAFDFPAGGLWETDDTVVVCTPGTTIFLKQGSGRMRFGADVIEIGAGACAHLSQAMRHSEPTGADHIRVLLTFRTPVDHRFKIRTYRLLETRA